MQIVLSSLLTLLLIISFFSGVFFPTSFTTAQTKHAGSSFHGELPDFTNYTDVTKKKEDFFAYLLPKVKHANDNILKERRLVFKLQSSLPSLSSAETESLSQLKEKYEIELSNHQEAINELIKRVDIIPASLALAQAANESAWGTSRFAQEGNNLFGQWCYVKGCGIIPSGRHGKQRHEVAKFDSILDSIESYMRNLNSQFSYEKLRTLRTQAREDENMITGINLANGLWSYSIRREAYVDEIQLMIKQNSLQQYNRSISSNP
ncbi:glucosaminidase domain-containing protein [Pseudomonas sp. HK3]|jgi:Bax protein